MIPPAQATWQTPPEPIAAMLDAKRLPSIGFSPDAEWIIELEPSTLPPIVELAVPKVALAGLQLNPQTWGPAKPSYYQAIAIRRRSETIARPITLPKQPRIRNLNWSRCNRYLAFTHTYFPSEQTSEQAEADKTGISLWVIDLEKEEARALSGPVLNGVVGSPFRWLPDNTLLCKIRTDVGAPPAKPIDPVGPIVEESLGRVAPARTYTNLLETPHDEQLLEHYLTSQLTTISLNGEQRAVAKPDLFQSFSPSPDGKWVKAILTRRPFSYTVPLSRFPKDTVVFSLSDERGPYIVSQLPLAEEIPIDFDSVRPGKRASGWRADKPATLYWVEALDGGDARAEVEYRDRILTLEAPFTGEPQLLWQSKLRYNSIVWGNGDIAIAYEAMYNTRQVQMWRLWPDQGPNKEHSSPVLLQTRNFQDAYSSPGEPVTTAGSYGWQVLLRSEQGDIYFNGRGASPDGVYPFLDRFNLETKEKKRLWQSPEDSFSRVSRVLTPDASEFIVRRSTKTEPGNYALYTASPAGEEHNKIALTDFSDPLPWYKDVHKEIVRYIRSDGLELSGTLYLPPGYDPEKQGPLPTLLWVYPEEHKSRETASQVTTSENSFGRPSRASVMFLLTQGYGLLLGASMPIIGEANAEPNDTYIEQLIDSAEAAVNYLVERGVSDPERIAIGGHSYGAFTTANLLAHTDLFAAGIARSGAYNRSLTPFGFQGEQRSYWEATNTYNRMSPFTYADKINHPLLLIHGAADNNSGTYPMQSDRLYEAMKGLGGTVRYVSLPYEEHGYRSREAIGHVLWEMVQWLNTYVRK
ncbi:MAG: prolyl oligopeptidase family serine peptidase [Cyanobacteria bacterium J06621_3]